jgi:SWI/SNF-related matrix-associated actin-dependent regulator 1 of chromatin subfamily A
MPLFSGRSSNHDHVSNDGGKSMLQHFVKLEKGGGTDKTAYARLKQLFAPFVLRRTKIEVLTQILPEKVSEVEYSY